MWERYGEEFNIDDPDNNNIWDAIVNYMDDEIREAVHMECAPCSKRYFLETYLEHDPNFEYLLGMEFGIEWM